MLPLLALPLPAGPSSSTRGGQARAPPRRVWRTPALRGTGWMEAGSSWGCRRCPPCLTWEEIPTCWLSVCTIYSLLLAWGGGCQHAGECIVLYIVYCLLGRGRQHAGECTVLYSSLTACWGLGVANMLCEWGVGSSWGCLRCTVHRAFCTVNVTALCCVVLIVPCSRRWRTASGRTDVDSFLSEAAEAMEPSGTR